MNQLEQLTEEFLKMGEDVKGTVHRAIDALVKKNTEVAVNIINQDDLIDNKLIVIEDKVASIFTDHNPQGKELRTCMSILKLAIDLERIGDYATNIAEIVLELKDEKYIKPLIHIPQLAAVALNMLDVSLKTFENKDFELAEAVCKKDEEADNLYEEIYDEITHLLARSAELTSTVQATRFLLIAGYLERIADHATNIGEETIFIHTGKRVRY